MGTHVIVGAGPVGTATAQALVAARVTTSSWSRGRARGPIAPGLHPGGGRRLRPGRPGRRRGSADALYNCANPPYHRWPRAVAADGLGDARGGHRPGAVLVTMGNLYGYGPVDHPMTEDDPLAATGAKGRVRAAMWAEALAAHRAGRVRVTEARASDFYGPGVVDTSHFGRNVARLLAGRKTCVLGDPDAPHAADLRPRRRPHAGCARHRRARLGPPVARPDGAGGEPAASWPSGSATIAGAPPPRVRSVPPALLTGVGVFAAQVRGLRETRYQFDRPFLLDSSAAVATFGIEADAHGRGVRRHRPPRPPQDGCAGRRLRLRVRAA